MLSIATLYCIIMIALMVFMRGINTGANSLNASLSFAMAWPVVLMVFVCIILIDVITIFINGVREVYIDIRDSR